MAFFQTDEDIRYGVVALLRERGHDVVTALDARLLRTMDERQLLHAATSDRIFMTYNFRDFVLLHRAWRLWSETWKVEPPPSHGGILVLVQPPRANDEEIVDAIESLMQSGTSMANALFRWQRDGWLRVG